ncbi:phosphotransferase [Coxiella burnetii]|uniref:Phosphotransferase n=1 Tax=Coxiella burnetii (strain Dugway 5J108-111) TaxID=434922 RepID=A9KFD6_COXBN|nr:phosphotransferase [Coxiella burnetii]ABS78116.2 phosphotransferase [Coxiella burnetii Dugway 5J108-111]
MEKSSHSTDWDNRIFRLGEHMLVRLPSAANYAAQVEKEHQWLPKLAPLLPLPIPTPIAIGEPTSYYPWKWSIYN